jgi:hypothetical protein
MGKIVLDADLRAKLNGLNETVEVWDESGRLLGHFVPLAPPVEPICPWDPTITLEELERRRQEPGGRTLPEIWKRLGAS